MANRTAQARRLARHLSRLADVPVELVYDTGVRWIVTWNDGPTWEQMREHLTTALAGPDYPDLRDRTLSYTRFTSDRAWASRAIHARRDPGFAAQIAEKAAWSRANLPPASPYGTPDPLTYEDHALLALVKTLLAETPYPDRATAPDDEADIEQLLAAGVNKVGVTSEYKMARVLRAIDSAPEPTDRPALRVVANEETAAAGTAGAEPRTARHTPPDDGPHAYRDQQTGTAENRRGEENNT
jgi:hypothetical protein